MNTHIGGLLIALAVGATGCSGGGSTDAGTDAPVGVDTSADTSTSTDSRLDTLPADTTTPDVANAPDAASDASRASEAGADVTPTDAIAADAPMPPPSCAPAPTSSMSIDATSAPYSARGDGTTDDTAALQRAIDAIGGSGGTLVIPAGTYVVNAVTSLRLRSNMTLRLATGAILRALPTGAANYDIIRISGASHVTVIGGTLQGERAGHTGTGGEFGMGLSIHASQHVVIDGVTARDCWGDGFYVSDISSDVTLCRVVSDHNRRQGISITSVDGLQVLDSTFRGTTGTLPEDGLDIEPNAGETVNNVTIRRCVFQDNAGFGIEDGVALANTGTAHVTAVVIDSCEVYGNGIHTVSTSPRAGIECSNSAGHTITNCRSHDNLGEGILLRNNANNFSITNNVINHNGTHGIEEYLCMGNTITGNTVTNNAGHGIYSPSSTGETLSGNTVMGNGLMP